MRSPRRLRAPALAMALALAMLAAAAVAYAEPAGQRPVPHPIQGRETCVVCHAGRTNETCLVCHLGVPPVAPTAQPGAQPTPTKFAVSAPTAIPDPNAACLSCHSNPSLTVRMADGEPLGLYVDNRVFTGSVHGNAVIAPYDLVK